VHLLDDVHASHKLTFDVELRQRWPIRKIFDRLPDRFTLKHVHVLDSLQVVELEDSGDIVAEAAAGHLEGTFHEKHDVVLSNPLLDLLGSFSLACELFFCLRLKVGVSFFVYLARKESRAARYNLTL